MKRSASVRAAVAKSREARLRATERRVGRHLNYLRRHDRGAYDQFLAMLRRVVARAEAAGGAQRARRA